jgi:hypothetical protein
VFLFLLLLRIFDAADQLFVLGIFERPFDRDEALGICIVNPVTSRTESLVRARQFRFPDPPTYLKNCPACWTDRGFLELPLQFIGVVFVLLNSSVSASSRPDGILEWVDMLRRTLLG